MEGKQDMPQNYFDINNEFFLIDSNNLENTNTKLYGYSIQDDGIIEDVNRTKERMQKLCGCGVYVYVENDGQRITIRQDFNASYGLFLYQKEDYFAISNSFQYLVDFLKGKCSLSLNRNYANHMIDVELASLSINETMVQEIMLLSRNTVISINIIKKQLELTYIDYEENKYAINSKEGIKLLDEWFARWVQIFKGVKAKTNNLTASLSGGFDSRITFLLILKSGINLNEIRVHSIKDDLHTHSEDYKIASEIAEHYGFKLNKDIFSKDSICYSLEDIINIVFYNKISFHKEMWYKYRKFKEKRYFVSGSGGESIRNHWNLTPKQFTQIYLERADRYSNLVKAEMKDAIGKILDVSYEFIKEKYTISDKQSQEIAFNLHREARCRSHFGTGAVDDFFANSYSLAPLLDPILRKFQLEDSTCKDKNLLMALIYERYCPELLLFEFEGGRSIAEDTIAYARVINENYPIKEVMIPNQSENDSFDIVVYDETVLTEEDKNLPVEVGYPDKFLKMIFDSRAFKNLFCTFFEEEIYTYAKRHYEKASYFPMRECYTLIAIVKTLLDTMEYEKIKEKNAFSMVNLFDKFPQNKEDASDILDRLTDYITARIDLKMKNNGDFEIVKNSDPVANDRMPAWQQKDGKGHVIESRSGRLDIAIRALTDGEITIQLKGRDVRDQDGARVPYWIDYQKFLYNSVVIFEEKKPAWHDKGLVYSYPVMKDEVIRLHIEWLPHFAQEGDSIKRASSKIDSVEKRLDELYILCNTIAEQLETLMKSQGKSFLKRLKS